MEVQKPKIQYLDFIFFIIFIIFISKDAFNFVFGGNLRNLILAAVYIYFILRIFVFTLLQNKNIYFSKCIIATVSLILLSAFWSGDIINSLKLSIYQILLPTLVIIFMGNCYKINTILKVTFISGAIMAFSSFIIFFVNPSLGIKTDGYISTWTGIFTNKNLLANSSSFHLIISIFLFFYEKNLKLRLVYITFAILHFSLMILSNSSTGIIVTAITLLIPITLSYIYKIRNKYLVISSVFFYVIFVGACIFIFINLLDEIVFSLGKDLTFTGRTIIWQIVFDMIKEKPLLGYGYGTFWEEGSPTYNYVNGIIGVLSSHNGFLDIVTSIGFIGLIFIVVSLYIYIKRNLSLYFIKKNSLFLLPLMYLVYLITYNMQESFFIEQNFIMWIFFVYFYIFPSIEKKHNDASIVSRIQSS